MSASSALPASTNSALMGRHLPQRHHHSQRRHCCSSGQAPTQPLPLSLRALQQHSAESRPTGEESGCATLWGSNDVTPETSTESAAETALDGAVAPHRPTTHSQHEQTKLTGTFIPLAQILPTPTGPASPRSGAIWGYLASLRGLPHSQAVSLVFKTL